MAITSYDKALSIGVATWLNDYRDNVTNTSPTLKAMKALGGVRTEAGGTVLLRPVRHTSNSVLVVGATPADASTYLVSAESDQVADASFNWAQLWAGIGISERELNKLANDPAKMATYVNSYVKNAVFDMGKKINTDLHATGYVYGSETAIGNLNGAIYTSGTYGGIDAGAQAFWRSTVTDAASGVASLAMVDNLLTTVQSVDGEQPNLIVTTAGIFSKLRSAMVGYQSIVLGNSDPGALGMQACSYNGAVMVADASCIAETIYAINTNTLQLVLSSDDIQIDEIKDMTPMRKWRALWNCQLTCDSRKANGKLITVKLA